MVFLFFTFYVGWRTIVTLTIADDHEGPEQRLVGEPAFAAADERIVQGGVEHRVELLLLLTEIVQ